MYKTKDLTDNLLAGSMSSKNRAELISDIGAAKAPLLVADNDAKQLLTSLSDGQEVEVTGEGGRIERYNGDNAGLLTSIRVNHPVGTTDYPPNTLAGYTNQSGGKPNYNEGLTGSSVSIQWDSTKWIIYNSGLGIEWESTEDVASPDLVTTWTAVSAAAQALDPLTSAMVTRAPEATESNWFAIKNTVYLTVSNDAYSGAFDFMGATIADGASVGIGWVFVSEALPTTAGTLVLAQVEGDNRDQSEKVIVADGYATLADKYPRGALVTIGTPA